jgi:predicted PurR-regulated permease PerM
MADEKTRLQNRQSGIFGNPAPSWGWLAAAVAVAIIIAVLVLTALWLFGRPLSLLILGIAIASALSPVANLLSRRMPRTLALLLIYFLILAVFGVIGWIIIPPLASQVEGLIETGPNLLARLEEWYLRVFGDIPILETLIDQVGQFGGALLAVPLGFASALFEIFLVLFISFYALLEGPKIRRFALSLFPSYRQEKVDQVMCGMVDAMGGFVRGAVITAVIIGLITYFGLLFIGVPFPLALGILAGVLELLPYIGPILAFIPITLIAFLQSPTQGLIVLVFFIILQQLESNILTPNIMRTQTEISPLMVLLAILAGGSLGGLLGALVAIPVAAALRVFVRMVVAPAIRKNTGASKENADEVQSEEGEKENDG